MSTEQLRRNHLLEQAIRDLLSSGTSPSISEIEDKYASLVASSDPGKPFTEKVALQEDEVSSSSKMNKSLVSISSDLSILYQGLIQTTAKMLNYGDRWKRKSSAIETKLDRLIDKTKSILTLTQNIEGYFSFVEDNFADLTKVDLTYTTAGVDSSLGLVSIIPKKNSSLSPLIPGLASTRFSLLNKQNITATSTTGSSSIANLLNNSPWMYRAFASTAAQSRTAELLFEFKQTEKLNKLFLKLHSSATTSPLVITPLYSTNGFNYQQLPLAQPSISTVSSASFIFPEIEVKFLKFILLKEGHDYLEKLQYVYEFGFNSLSLFHRTYEEDSSGELVSKIHTITSPDGTTKKFNMLVL